jgi:hypothetical protein
VGQQAPVTAGGAPALSWDPYHTPAPVPGVPYRMN